MRIRRARSPLKALQTQLNPLKFPARALFFGENSPLQRRVFPRPTENAPSHSQSRRTEYVLDKYSTGMIVLEGLLRERSLLERISLKVYGRKPFPIRAMLQTLSYSLESTPVTGGLRSTLIQLASVTFNVLKVFARLRNVYFQTFEGGKRTRNRIEGARQPPTHWNLSCQLSREHDGGPPSKPWFELAVNDVDIGPHCKIKQEESGSMFIEPRVAFHLKPQLLEVNSSSRGAGQTNSTGTDNVGETLQNFVTSFVNRIYRSVRGRIFSDIDETVSVIQNDIVAYLRSSPLRDVVEFSMLQNTITRGRIFQRLAHITPMNADGSAKMASTDLEMTSNAQDMEDFAFDDGRADSLPKMPHHGNGAYHTMSEAVGEKLGCREFHCQFSSNSGTALAAHESSSRDLLDELDRICRSTDANGFASFASAVASSSDRYARTVSAIESKNFPINVTVNHDHIMRPATVKLGASLKTGMAHAALPVFVDLDLPLKGSVIKWKQLGVTLYAKHTGKLLESALNISANEEFNVLTQMALTVVQAVCEDVEFESPEAGIELIAEGILRTLRFPSTGIGPEMVGVTAQVKSPFKRAFWIKARKSRSQTTLNTLRDIESEAETEPLVTETTQVTTASNTPEVPIEEATPESQHGDLLVHPEVSTSGSDSGANFQVMDKPTEDEIAEDSVVENEAPDQQSGFRKGRVFVALGSNLGERLENIEKACQEIDGESDMRILRTSALYETAPMYVEDQAHFLNGVCEIETSLSPIELLDKLQAIEQRLGRVKTIDKGPRNIDLDILIFRNEKLQTDRLTIPHPLMAEREFVLRPLCDISTARKRRTRYPQRFYELLAELPKTEKPMCAVSPLAPHCPDIRLGDASSDKTLIMSILNMTPDSFSDGGLHQPAEAERLASFAKAQIAAGASIIDIGGQSSRPNAPDVSAEEEISRILPAINAVKSLPEAAKVAISVDTYRAAVADAAIKAGAHIINDISAGLLDPEMLPTIARLGCTYIMMHMRGSPATMMSAENCTYPDGLINTIIRELGVRHEAAQAAGIRRWRIILDPGIGFSKTAEQNLEILRKFSEFKKRSHLQNFAWLVGSSRKSFIGKITGVEDPKKRGWGSAATVTAAIQGGANIVRVHDAEEMNAVVKMADALRDPHGV